jgi:hypothetical protein
MPRRVAKLRDFQYFARSLGFGYVRHVFRMNPNMTAVTKISPHLEAELTFGTTTNPQFRLATPVVDAVVFTDFFIGR